MSYVTVSPLDRLKSLDHRKRRAFLALFAGARREMQGARLPDGREIPPTFGKAECEWVADWRDFYGRELPALGLLTFYEGEPPAGLRYAAGQRRVGHSHRRDGRRSRGT